VSKDRLQIALCNEVLQPLPFARQCEIAKALGYDGLELAPFTVSEAPEAMTEQQARDTARIASDHGLAITGLHWLLVKPAGLSITTTDAALHNKTVAFMQHLCALAEAMGARYLVHGSPGQRAIASDQTRASALARASEAFAQAGEAARKHGVVYCIEPLSRDQTPIINTVAEAAEIVRAIDNPHLRTMIDTSSAGLAETEPLPDLIARWMPTGLIAHVQVNDPNRRAPGQGDMRFAPILRALLAARAAGHYDGIVAAEPFDYVPDGMGSAAFSAAYLKGLIEALETSHG
jgi:sugar phosphate isomerase/epimerase